MAIQNAIQYVETWLYETLIGDAAIAAVVEDRVYNSFAPVDAEFPFVVFALLPSEYVQGVGECRIQTNAHYKVVIVTDGAPDDAAVGVVTRFDEVVGQATAQTLNSWVFSARGESPVRIVEPNPGTPLIEVQTGSIYKVIAYPAAP